MNTAAAGKPALQRDGLILVLTLIAGCIDAISFLGLEQVFTANMTGNLVLFGLAVGQGQWAPALRSGVAFLGFAAGAIAGARIAGRDPGPMPWPSRVTAVLAAELAVLGGVALGWWLTSGPPGDGRLTLLVATAAAAMGLQSIAVLRLAVPGVSTTYVTGMLTTLVGQLATASGSRFSSARYTLVIATMGGGAALGAFLHHHHRSIAPVVPAALLALVVVTALVWFGRRRHPGAHSDGPAA